MNNYTVSNESTLQTIPKLTSDVTLKRARAVDSNGNECIRITNVNGGTTNTDNVITVLGTPGDTVDANTIMGVLKRIVASFE